MKAIIRKMFCYLLAGLVFISSTGFGLVEHSCLMSRKEKVVMSEGQSCCSAKKSTKGACQSQQSSSEQDACCTEETQHTKVDVSTSLVQVMSDLLASLCVAVISIFSFLFNSLIEAVTASVHVSYSPPRSGRSLLIFLHTLLI